MNLRSHIGKARGSMRDKDNRVQRLINNWEYIKNKMVAYIIAGNGTSLRARCAYGVLLMCTTGIRIGNESSAEGYVCDQKHHPDYGKIVNVYGLTTLLPEHAQIGKGIYLNFLGKKAVQQSLSTFHPTLLQYAKSVNLYHGLPTWLGIEYSDIYSFVKRSLGHNYKPKDIRTAAVNILFLHNVEKYNLLAQQHMKKGEIKKDIGAIIEKTANTIGHTKGVCRNAYLSKHMLTTLQDKLLTDFMKRKEQAKTKRR